ncbi:MAG TPA: SiaC family regulatory phosphoprotein [Alphaproteobacteria bacterium]|nr:SiaC family regulatory phosphoprotein [Alphaproteobacteria bacterium]
MQPLTIPATRCSPLVEFDPAGGRLRIEGESYPENSFEFFAPVFAALAEALEAGTGPVTLELSLSYLNTSSIKCMIDILDMLEAAHKSGRPVAVLWHCDRENDRALEMAEEFKEDVSLPFSIVAR